VCSAAVGLATVMVLTFTSPVAFESRSSLLGDPCTAAGIAVPLEGAATQARSSG
jgi:hypothetical protein